MQTIFLRPSRAGPYALRLSNIAGVHLPFILEAKIARPPARNTKLLMEVGSTATGTAEEPRAHATQQPRPGHPGELSRADTVIPAAPLHREYEKVGLRRPLPQTVSPQSGQPLRF